MTVFDTIHDIIIPYTVYCVIAFGLAYGITYGYFNQKQGVDWTRHLGYKVTWEDEADPTFFYLWWPITFCTYMQNRSTFGIYVVVATVLGAVMAYLKVRNQLTKEERQSVREILRERRD